MFSRALGRVARRTGATGIRRISAEDVSLRRAVVDLCEQDPIVSVMVRRQVDELGRRHAAYGELYARIISTPDGPVADAALWAGANLIPLGAPDAIEEFAALAAKRGRRCSSIVGEVDLVRDLWDRLKPMWTAPRDERFDQHVLVQTAPVIVEPEPGVRIATDADAARIIPAAIAMYTEEVGYDPRRFGSGYENHIRSQISAGRTFVMTEGEGEDAPVLFTAEVGVLAGGVAQIHGVWVDPERRGHGLGTRAMARVCELTKELHAPIVSLYVNAYNTPAMRVYERCGFTQHATFATILF